MIPTHETFGIQLGRWDLDRGVGFDVETNGKEVWEPGARVVGLTLAGIDKERGVPTGMYFPLSHEVGANCHPSLLDDIVKRLRTLRLIPFSAQTEFQWALAKWGIRVPIVGDGYIAARLLQLEWFGLKDLVTNVLKRPVLRLEDVLGEGKYDFAQVDAERDDVQTYVCDDGINAWLIESVLKEKLQAAGLTAVYQLEVQAALIMAEQQLHGYVVDARQLAVELANEEARAKNLELDIFKDLRARPFTINSGVQLGKHLNAAGIHSPLRTPTGKESWTQESLAMLEDRYPVARKLREWKSGFSVVNGLKKSPPQAAADGKLHPRWRSIGVTGSAIIVSEKPDFTTLPEVARKAFVAPPGRRWMGLDWKLAEPMFYAALSKDDAFTALLTGPEDPHMKTAVLLGFAAPHTPSPVLSGEYVTARREAKMFLWRYLYGGGDAQYIADRLGLPIGPAQDLTKAFGATYPKLQSFLLGVRQYASDTRHVRTWLNRRRKLEGVKTAEDAMSAACAAIGQQSVATAQKVLLTLIASRRDFPLFNEMANFIPCGDTIYYTIPLDVPVREHVNAVSEIARLHIGGTEEAPVFLEPVWETGGAWGSLKVLTPESLVFAQQYADLQLDGEAAA